MITEGIVYILSNEAMPGLVKIGMTTREEIEIRMSELYSTGVPLPFQCEFAGKVNDVKTVEKAFHTAFGPNRVNPSREFFKIAPEQAMGLLKILCTEDMTPQVESELDKVDEVSKQAVKSYRKKRPPLDFIEMGFDIGDVLQACDFDETCEIVGNKKVLFRGEEISLTRATRILLQNDYNIAPGPHWEFNNQRIRDIYNETYPAEES